MSRSRVIALVIAIVIIVAALAVRVGRERGVAILYREPIPTPGPVDSEHAHMNMLVFLDGKLFDFSRPQYQLQSELVHFEDDNGTYIHKHATGITLPYLFDTLGMKLTSDCFITDTNEEFCSQKTGPKQLKVYINRVWFDKTEEIARYELQEGDKILINYSDDSEMEAMIKMNNIKDIPEDF